MLRSTDGGIPSGVVVDLPRKDTEDHGGRAVLASWSGGGSGPGMLAETLIGGLSLHHTSPRGAGYGRGCKAQRGSLRECSPSAHESYPMGPVPSLELVALGQE